MKKKNQKFWTELRPCIVLRADSSLWGNQVQKRNLTSFGQNQGLAWSSDSSLWGNQVQKRDLTSFGQNQGLAWSSDSSLWGNQVHKKNQSNHKFWTKPRPCMILRLKPLGKPTTCKEKLHYMHFRIYPRKTLH